jgi:hypothetical protein
MAFSIRCPECRKKFPWKPTEGFPDQCPNPDCKTNIGLTESQIIDIPMPFLSSAKNRSVDKVYRDMEAGSEVRANAAAEMTGATAAEMSALKITNMNTGMRNGDIAAPSLANNPVAQMVSAPQSPFGFQGNNGLGFSGPVASGPFANSGAKFQSVLRSAHAERVGYDAVGDRPANEMFSPNYRRRA